MSHKNNDSKLDSYRAYEDHGKLNANEIWGCCMAVASIIFICVKVWIS